MTVRPATIRAVSILLTIVAAVYLVGLIIDLVLLFSPREDQLLIDHPMSRLVWRGDRAVGATVSVLCVITGAFSLFGLAAGFGWGALAMSITILVLNSSKSAQRWYDSISTQ